MPTVILSIFTRQLDIVFVYSWHQLRTLRNTSTTQTSQSACAQDLFNPEGILQELVCLGPLLVRFTNCYILVRTLAQTHGMPHLDTSYLSHKNAATTPNWNHTNQRTNCKNTINNLMNLSPLSKISMKAPFVRIPLPGLSAICLTWLIQARFVQLHHTLLTQIIG